eukprot:gene21509-27852_t
MNNDILFISEGEPFYLSTIENINLSVLGAGGVDWEPTIEDAYRKPIRVDDSTTMLEILDTAGQEDYSTMRAQWMTNKDGDGIQDLFTTIVREVRLQRKLKSYLDNAIERRSGWSNCSII